MEPTIDSKRALQHLTDLLGVEGLSGQETKVAICVRAKLLRAGCRPEWIRHDSAHRRLGGDFQTGNLIVRLPGRRGESRRLLVAHLDTVPLCRGAKPQRVGDRIVARRATALGADNRTGVACLVTTAEAILRGNLSHPPLTFLFTVGEEVGLRGATVVRTTDLGRPAMAFNVDSGTPAKFIVGAVGAIRWRAEIRGHAAHAGVHPEDGVSAILIAGQAIANLSAAGYFGKIEKGRFRGTSNVGVIRGGETTNQVTDRVMLRGECRSHDRRFLVRLARIFERTLTRTARGVRDSAGRAGEVAFESHTDYLPFRIPRSAACVTLAARAARTIGLTPEYQVSRGGQDANPLNARGLQTVTFGAGQHGAHTLGEYVAIEEYVDGCRLALAIGTTPY